MAEVTSELMYEVLNNLQQRSTNVEVVVIEQAQSLNAIRGHVTPIQTGTNNIYSVLSRIDQRIELRELAEASAPFDHTR